MKPAYLQKNYYAPALLANGTDFCQLDHSGSMAFKAQIKGLSSYWYRKGRPNLADPLGIVRLSWQYISDFGPVEPGSFEQIFYAPEAVLKTTVEGYQFKLNIEVFLTDDHTLVETFTVLQSDAAAGKIMFPMMFGDWSYTNKVQKVFYDSPHGGLNIRKKTGDTTVEFDYFWQDEQQAFHGIGKSSLKIAKGSSTIVWEDNPSQSDNYFSDIAVSKLTVGDVIVRVTTLMDSLDGPDWEIQLATIHERALTDSPEIIKQKHIANWQKRTGSSILTCDNPDMQRAFEISKYCCSASLHPNGSTVSALAIPNGHGMGTYWDAWYVHQGLLAANCISEAKKIIDFWKMAAANGRKAAAALGAEGIRFPWTLDFEGKAILGDHPQIHNNAIPIINIWQQYKYTLNENILCENFELMREALRFISSYALRKDKSGKPYLRELIPVDENPQRKKDELLTTIVFLKGVDVLLKAAQIIGKRADRQLLEEQKAFQTILNRLKKDDTWIIYEGGNAGGWATFMAHIHLPRPGKLKESFSAALDFCKESHGLGPGKTSRMRCASWPWLEGVAAWSMARNLDRRALYWLENILQSANFHGALPEYVWEHGEPSREWFVAAHGTWLAALAEILVQRDDDKLLIFPLGTDIPWLSNLQVKKLRLPGALLLSLDCRDDNSCRVTLENVGPKPQNLTINVHGANIDETTISAQDKQEFVITTVKLQ